MSTGTDAPPSVRTVRAREVAAGVDRFGVAIAAVVLVQAGWLGYLLSRGWYYQADLSNLVDGRGRLSVAYLTQSQGGHLAIGDRLTYWLMFRTIPLNFAATVALRIALQAVMTVLLYRLLVVLVGRRPGVVVVSALYAFSPLSIQTWQWVTASVAFLPAQILVLLALHAHVRYAATLRLRWALATAAYLFASVVFSEQAVIIALILPLLSIGYLHAGSFRERLRAVARCWPEWALIATPLVLFLAYFFGSGKFVKSDSTGLTVGQAVHVVEVELTSSLFPALVGGPLTWLGSANNFLSISDPATWLRVVGAAFAALLLVVGFRCTGWRSLLAWAMPVLVLVVGIVVVAVGRYTELGLIIARQFEHTGYVAIPLAVATALAFWSGAPDDVAARLGATGSRGVIGRRHARRRVRLAPTLVAGVVVAILTASIASEVTYTDHWAQSPARDYVQKLDSELDRVGSNVGLYDTPVNSVVIPIISPHHYVSDILALLGRTARFDSTGQLQIVGSDGSIGPAAFLPATRGVQAADQGCAVIIRGAGDWTVPFDHVPHRSEYFLRMSYLQPRGSVVDLAIRDSTGRRVEPVGGTRSELLGTLSTLTTRLPLGAPAALLIHSDSLATNLCLSNITIGSPFPVKR